MSATPERRTGERRIKPRPIDDERRKLTDRLYNAARTAYQNGRGDRVAGYPPAIAWKADHYYMAGYNGEAAKETLQSAADLV